MVIKRLNKKAWIRVVEAFLSALLIIAVVLVVINQQTTQANESQKSLSMYNQEVLILRYIELNNTLRGEVTSSSISDTSLPLKSGDSQFPTLLNKTINSRTPSSLICQSQICKFNGPCDYSGNVEEGIYSQQVLITTDITVYHPRKLKIFCWER